VDSSYFKNLKEKSGFMKELGIFWLLFDLAFSETFHNFSYLSELGI
jgi:hypothetical protein